MLESFINSRPNYGPAEAFYSSAMEALEKEQIPYLVGGAHAFYWYTGIVRDTKDFDVFVHPANVHAALAALARAGYDTELTYPHWIGKAFCGEYFLDIIFASGNGVCPVDDEWFKHAVEGIVLDRRVKLCPAEEIIWSKAYIMERERYDGADILHILRARAQELDWPRLLRRFHAHWRVLFSHLVLFGFVYPSERHRIPSSVLEEMDSLLHREMSTESGRNRICYGTLLSRAQYLIDIEQGGYADARFAPYGPLRPGHLERWTADIPTESRQI